MLNSYPPTIAGVAGQVELGDAEKLSVLYHGLFDYPLTLAELVKWRCTARFSAVDYWPSISQKDGYFFLEDRRVLIYQRLLRKRISAKKLEVAKRASGILSFISTVKMVAVTGSLAMGNATEESDIDLMIVTQKNTLWLTRLLAYCLLQAAGYKLRKPKVSYARDALCLNMWLDEDDLVFQKRNIYTAHEIAQIIPLVNKDKTYEKFLEKNKWILSYWPNAVKVRSPESRAKSRNFLIIVYCMLAALLEPISFWLQYQYMKSKITREVVTPTRALFHPQDWGKMVLDKLNTSFLK